VPRRFTGKLMIQQNDKNESHLIKENTKDTLRDKVYNYLKKEMENGNLYPGNAVSVKEICTKLKISTQPVRDAIIRLEAEGFLNIYPRSRVVINALDINEIKNLYEVIGALEICLLESSFEKFSDIDIVSMKNLNQEMRKAIENGDYIAFSKPHWDFHNLLIDLSDNYIVKRVIKPMKFRLWNAPRRRFHKEWEMMCCDEHEQIVEAIKERNLRRALRVIKKTHWSFKYNEDYVRWVYCYA
jgi:DNA-binding GntR family transcriptional regulator